MLRSGAKKNDTGPNILKFPTLEPLKNSTSLKCATHQLESLKHFVESVIFFASDLIKKNLYVFHVAQCIFMTKLHSLSSKK